MSTEFRFIVKQFRTGEAAPSLSLAYRAETARGALEDHFRCYPGGVADGTWYAVEAAGMRSTFDTDRSRAIYLDALESDDDDTPHVGHYSRIGGTYWCDTCNSPYCDRA